MRGVVQRVSRADVKVDGSAVAEIGRGLLVLLGVTHEDTEEDARALARKLVGLRVFADAAGAMNLSVAEVGGAVLVVSQFTLYGDSRRGRRPSFGAAASPGRAEPLVTAVVEAIEGDGIAVQTGRFGAMMAVELVNDGPVTLILETWDGRVV